MKKLLVLCISLFSGSVAIYAQAPTITSANMYAVNEVEVLYLADSTGVMPGASGANVTWDFSALKAISPTDSAAAKFVYPGTTTYGSDFPTADFAQLSTGGGQYAYMTFKNNTLAIIGNEGYQDFQGTSVLIKQTFDKPQVLYAFPLTYNTNQTNDFHASYDVSGITVNLTGTQKTIGDGYGTLKIMGKTYMNVLRIHATNNEADSASGFPGSVITNSESWSYLMPGKKDPILTISNVTQVNGGTSVGYKQVTFNINDKTAGVNTPRLADANLSLYPNPAQTACMVNFSSAKAGNATLTVVNALGQQISEKNIYLQSGKNVLSLDINSMPKGIYFININSNFEAAQQRLIVE